MMKFLKCELAYLGLCGTFPFVDCCKSVQLIAANKQIDALIYFKFYIDDFVLALKSFYRNQSCCLAAFFDKKGKNQLRLSDYSLILG